MKSVEDKSISMINETYSINYERIFLRGILIGEIHGKSVSPKKVIKSWDYSRKGELNLETLLFRYIINSNGDLIGTHVDAEQLHMGNYCTNIHVDDELKYGLLLSQDKPSYVS